MRRELVLQDLRIGGPLLEGAIRKSLSLGSRTSEIRTNDEGLCSAYVVEVEKRLIASRAEAVVILSSLQLRWLEQWNRDGANEIDISNIAKIWLIPEFNRYSFQPLTKPRVEEVFQTFFRDIEQFSPSHLDVLIAGEYEKADFRRAFPSEPAISGLSLRNDWNCIEMLYETTNLYGLYRWGTGA